MKNQAGEPPTWEKLQPTQSPRWGSSSSSSSLCCEWL